MVHPCVPEHIYQGTSWGSLEGPVALATSWQRLQLLQQQRPESNSKKMMVRITDSEVKPWGHI